MFWFHTYLLMRSDPSDSSPCTKLALVPVIEMQYLNVPQLIRNNNCIDVMFSSSNN